MVKFSIEKFDGPLSLLLQMIEQEELDITQISLAKIADQYIEYIKEAKNIDPEEMADFLVVAARLILIKSKALLPYLFPEEEEEIKEFENQLKMYQEFLAATKKVTAIIGKKRFMFSRPFNRKVLFSGDNFFAPPKKLVAADLAMVMSDLIGRIRPAEVDLEERRLEPKINIDDKIAEIRSNIFTRLKMRFSQVLELAKSKTEIIVSFLAMLELIKQKEVLVDQLELFGEIEINKI
jgi:segregation and condensation protein A